MGFDLYKSIVAKTTPNVRKDVDDDRPALSSRRRRANDVDASRLDLALETRAARFASTSSASSVVPATPRSTSTKRTRKLGKSVSIVGDGVEGEVVARGVPVTASKAREGEERETRVASPVVVERSMSDVCDDGEDAAGALACDAERSMSTSSANEREKVTMDARAEAAVSAEAMEALREALEAIRACGVEPWRALEALAMPHGGGFDGVVRAIDAFASVKKASAGKRLSFSAATPVGENGDAVARAESAEARRSASIDEELDVTADGDDIEGTVTPCECGVDDCALTRARARGGPFRLPSPVVRMDEETVASTDEDEVEDSESVAATDDGDLDDDDDAKDARDLGDALEALNLGQSVVEEGAITDEEACEDVEPQRVPTHVRFTDSHISESPELATGRRAPRSRAARRKVLIDEESTDEDNATDEEQKTEESPQVTDADQSSEVPDVRSRPRRSVASKAPLSTRRHNIFVDDEASGSDETDLEDDGDDDDDANTSDDDFINDEDDEDLSDFAVEYDSEAENVTPAPRKPSFAPKVDLTKAMRDKLTIDPYSPSNLQTPTPPKEMSPNAVFNAFVPPPTHSKALQSALKSVAKKGAEKFNFNRHKDALAGALFAEFNINVFGSKLPKDFEVTWNNKLLTTAGLTHYKRSSKTGDAVYSARIELSTKVLDTVEKLEATLLHEMCHASAWLVDKVAKPPHGPVFKKWATLAMHKYPETNVSTCHGYAIHQPYKWRCTRDWCQQEYGRHSKSIDINSKACGACGGKLEYLGKFKKNGKEVQARAPTAFSLFVKENFKATKDKLGARTPHADVMKTLSKRWKDKTDEVRVIELE